MTVLAIKIYGLGTKDNSLAVNIDLGRFISAKDQVYSIVTKIFKKSFIYHFYNLFHSPVE